MHSLISSQQNIWNLQKYYEGTTISAICGAIYFKDELDTESLKKAINHVIEHQSGLRLRFCEVEGKAMQQVTEYQYEEIPVLQFSDKEALRQYVLQCAQKLTGLTDIPLYHFAIFQLDGQTGIVTALSHLISDAWTLSLIAKQVMDAYWGLAQGDLCDSKTLDYLDHVHGEEEYLASRHYEKDTNYWQEKYPDKPEPTTIKLCTAATTAITAKRITSTLGRELTKRIGQFCKETSLTPAVLFETTVILYLAKINPENQTVTIGTPVLGRQNAREKNTAGMFISTMPLTIPVSASDTAEALANRITDGHRELFRHQRYPYGSILRQLREKHDFTGNLYDVMVSYQNAQTGVNAETEWFSNGYSETPFVLHIDNRDNGSSYTWTVDYQTEVFRQEAEIHLIMDRLEHILQQILTNYKLSLSEISVIPDAEYQRMIFDFNDTAVDYPRDKCVHTLFEEQVERTPDKMAVIAYNETLTYRGLNEQANRIAHSLIEMGIGVGDVVAFALSRRSYLVAAMLGIMKAGAAYLPVDFSYPQDRIDYMLQDSQARLFITEENILDLLKNEHMDNLDVQLSSENLCYCIYTSGTTGKPKGVAIQHRNLVNFCTDNIKNNLQHYIAQSCTTVLACGSIAFDISLFEIMLSLICNKSVVLVNEEALYDIALLASQIRRNKVDCIHCTPTKLYTYLKNSTFSSAFKNMKCVMVGGELLTKDVRDLISQHSIKKIFNGYGPTETTMGVSFGEVDDTIGKPIANTQVYILDSHYQPLPIGVAGELCISGDGVGKGYLNRPELTTEKFVPNPFIPGKIMYRTGDLARWRADGEIEFLGRIDTQVKIRGLRIELGEIENVMAQFPGISIAVAADKRDESGRQYLVGYYIAETTIDEAALRQHLSAKLPKYMVPNYFVHLEKLPMTPSGKIDRKNLPLPHFTVQATEYVPPETEAEKQLCDIWSELLHMEQVGKTDDFFELGGDSLMAISVLSKIKSVFQTELSIRNVMENPVLERLADVIDRAERTSAVITPGHRGQYILLPQQKAIYAVCQKNPQSLAYNMPVKVRLSEQVDHDKLMCCLKEIVNHHDSLKTRIVSEGNEIYGIFDESAQLVVEHYSNEDYSAFLRPFALEIAPLVRVGFTEDSLLFDMHHIIADGDSLNIILREIVTMYAGSDATLSEVAYADYADYFQREDFSAHRDYFRSMLRCDFELVELPRRRDSAGTGGASLLFHLPVDVVDRGRKFAKTNGLTDTMLFLGVYGIMLSKYTGRADILSSVVLSNRTYSETADVVGMFVNTLPIYLPVSGDLSGYFGKIKDLVLNLYQYQELPFLEVADAVGMTDKSVVNTAFVYQADGEKHLKLDGEEFSPEWLDTKSAKFDLLFEVTPTVDGCTVRMEYDCTKYEEKLIENLFAAYEKVLEQLSAEKISDISVLSEMEYQKVVFDFNDTAVDYPRSKCVHELFAEQAEKLPDKSILIFENKQFTYRQMDEMSNALAHFLREKGIGRNDIVPIISKRSWHIIVAMLGILKAGGAYMPIDPSYPKERIEYMLNIAKCGIALTFDYEEVLGVNVISLSNFDFTHYTAPVMNLNISDDLCYVIFTSGSTGTPKGVSVCHRNMVNYCDNNKSNNVCHSIIKANYQSIVSVTNTAFDIFATESIFPLLNGITIYFANEEQAFLQERLSQLIETNDVDVIQTTPTKMRSYILDKQNVAYLKKFKAMILGGEALPVSLYQELRIYTFAHIFNIYGPTETTVWSTNKKIESDDITIGKPIANTQIYVLDQDRNPLPVGVAGELCISGDGVGTGYLNRPELTAERFIPNPFIRGTRMYCTGDLARWNEHGEIEYLGRIDTQVKIRGLRIELGEIESVMSQFSGISLTAAADRRDKNGRQYLVGYYTAGDPVDESALRQYLSEKLPKYMVPNYFLRLEKLPMTPSGKIDRKNLPLPDLVAHADAYIPPHNNEERILCEIIGEILHYKQVGIRDDFFELGGDSLKAIEFVTKAHGEGIYFALQNVFDYPTVEALCGYLQDKPEKNGVFSPEQFEKYTSILERNVWDEEFTPEQHKLGTVLLTGGTGFLGAHILDALMKHGVQKIYCLVRGSEERLTQRLQYYFGEQYIVDIGKTIIPIVGDLESETVGNDLPEQVDCIIHAAASVKHYGSWQYFKRANVDATEHIVSYALRTNAKLVYISTTSVSGNSMADQFDGYVSEEEKHFYESSLYIGQPLDNVYARSKFEAETLVLDAMREGLRANIIRMGNLTNRASDLKFQPNYTENAFLKRVKAVLDLGCLPDYLTSIYAEFTPIDAAAEAITKIVEHMNDKYTVFHVNSNQNLYFDKMLEYLERAGHPLEVLSGAEFAGRIRVTINSSQKYIFEALSNDLNQDDLLQYDSNIRIENSFTVQYLRSIGFEWPEIDYAYVKGYLDYFEQLGYWEG